MEIRVIDVIKKTEQWLPEKYAMPEDRIGLQTGKLDNRVKKIMVTLDVDEKVAEEAVAKEVDFIFAHHNPFYEPLTNYVADSAKGKLLQILIKNDISLFIAHTNLDVAFGGVNDVLADMFSLENVQPLSVHWKERYVKFAVNVPLAFEEKVRVAITDAGAGHIGNYSNVSFHLKGTGFFMPGQGTEPFIGSSDELTEVSEVKIETIVSTEKLDAVIKAMTEVHPYEEIAFDIIPLYNDGKKNGIGRIGYLSEPITLGAFIHKVQDSLDLEQITYAGDVSRHVYKVAICGGSGMSLYKDALQKGADVFVTSDIKYHDAQEALSFGLSLVDAGHYASEKPVVDKVANFLRLHFKEYLTIVTSEINTNPLKTFKR